MTFRPMLACAAPDDLTALRFPILMSPKIDGIRCVIRNGQALTRNLKPIPNRELSALLSNHDFDGFDGELTVGGLSGKSVWNRTQSEVMSFEGEPDFMFSVFDDCNHPGPFTERLMSVADRIIKIGSPRLFALKHKMANTLDDILAFEREVVSAGFEGVMLRHMYGPYKRGRSTQKEGFLMKLKRFYDAEALVIDAKERMHNGNAATTNALGLTERSTHKANKVGMDTLGALVCQLRIEGAETCSGGAVYGKKFDIGTGFDDSMRSELWAVHKSSGDPLMSGLFGRVVKLKYQELTPDGAPRFPVFLGFRDERDAG